MKHINRLTATCMFSNGKYVLAYLYFAVPAKCDSNRFGFFITILFSNVQQCRVRVQVSGDSVFFVVNTFRPYKPGKSFTLTFNKSVQRRKREMHHMCVFPIRVKIVGITNIYLEIERKKMDQFSIHLLISNFHNCIILMMSRLCNCTKFL